MTINSEKIEVQDLKKAWLIRTNNFYHIDGIIVCKSKSTAKRIAISRGRNERVEECHIFNFRQDVYAPVFLEQPTKDDLKADAQEIENQILEKKRQETIEKALALGLTIDELGILKKA